MSTLPFDLPGNQPQEVVPRLRVAGIQAPNGEAAAEAWIEKIVEIDVRRANENVIPNIAMTLANAIYQRISGDTPIREMSKTILKRLVQGAGDVIHGRETMRIAVPPPTGLLTVPFDLNDPFWRLLAAVASPGRQSLNIVYAGVLSVIENEGLAVPRPEVLWLPVGDEAVAFDQFVATALGKTLGELELNPIFDVPVTVHGLVNAIRMVSTSRRPWENQYQAVKGNRQDLYVTRGVAIALLRAFRPHWVSRGYASSFIDRLILALERTRGNQISLPGEELGKRAGASAELIRTLKNELRGEMNDPDFGSPEHDLQRGMELLIRDADSPGRRNPHAMVRDEISFQNNTPTAAQTLSAFLPGDERETYIRTALRELTKVRPFLGS